MKEYWGNFERTACYPNKCNCEYMNQGNFVVQPIATISNIPIILVGMFVLFKHFKNHQLFSLGFLIILTGLGSVVLHMTFTRFGQILDFSGIGFVFAWVVFYYYIPKKYFYHFLVLLISISYSVIYFDAKLRYPLVILFGVTSSLTLFKKEFKNKFYLNKNFIISIFSFFIGLLLFFADNKRIWCPSYRWIQGHTIWHFLVATSLYFFYEFFKEKEDLLDENNSQTTK